MKRLIGVAALNELQELTPDERKRAADLAKTLLPKNRNCCRVQ
jgi:hypothetical protein